MMSELHQSSENHDDESDSIISTDADTSFFDATNDVSILTTQIDVSRYINGNTTTTQESIYPTLELSQIVADSKTEQGEFAEHSSGEQIDVTCEKLDIIDQQADNIVDEVRHTEPKNSLFNQRPVNNPDIDSVDSAATFAGDISTQEKKEIDTLSERSSKDLVSITAKSFTRYEEDSKTDDNDLFTPSKNYCTNRCKRKNYKEKLADEKPVNDPNSVFLRQPSFNKQSHFSSPQITKSTTYEHPYYSKFDPVTKKYFQFLQRYHLADTLPIYFRAQIQMQLRSIGTDLLTIGVFGPPGVGKSAFLNSVYAAMNGEYVEYSAERKVNEDLSSSSTDARLELRLTETISLMDNRGTDFKQDSLKEISKQCEGYRDAGVIIPDDWNSSLNQKLKDFLSSCSKKKLFRNRIFCPVVVDSLARRDINLGKYKELIDTIKNACGYSPIIVLTHKDKILKDEDVTDRMRDFEQLNCNRLFSLTNYTFNSCEVNMEADKIVIQMLFNCCLVADQEMKMLLKRINAPCCKH